MDKMVKRYRVLKDLQIYHPVPLILEAGSVIKVQLDEGDWRRPEIPKKPLVLFGVIGKDCIMSAATHPEEFKEYFVEVPPLRF